MSGTGECRPRQSPRHESTTPVCMDSYACSYCPRTSINHPCLVFAPGPQSTTPVWIHMPVPFFCRSCRRKTGRSSPTRPHLSTNPSPIQPDLGPLCDAGTTWASKTRHLKLGGTRWGKKKVGDLRTSLFGEKTTSSLYVPKWPEGQEKLQAHD